jgi:peptidoglycan biosynthesis protein MviN/MurJ (putative lipid II flippase)
MLAGMVPMVCTVMLFKALFARHDVRTAALLGVAGPVLYLIGCGLSIHRFGLAGVGGTYLLTWMALATVATSRVAPQVWRWLWRRKVPGDLLLLVASAAAPALLLRWTILRNWDIVSIPGLTSRLIFAALIGIASYLWVGLFVVKVDDLLVLARSIRRQ